MRWVALLLLLVNVLLFWWLSSGGESRVHTVQEGKLPRVAEIQLIEEQGLGRSAPEPDAKPAQKVPLVVLAIDGAPLVREEDEIGSPAPVPDVPVVACTGIGWFDSESDSLAYRDRLLNEYPSLEFYGIRERSEPLEPFHWVIVPPLPSREQAVALYKALVGAGVEAYVVPSGEHENAISLGLFRSRASAERVLRQRQAENINATLVKFPRNRISYALVFRGAAVSGLSGTDAPVLESETGLQTIEFGDCEGVATAERNP